MKKIETIVYTTELSTIDYISDARRAGINCISAIDARSSIYMATGICAQSKKTTLVLVSGSNVSRSTFSGMTEAYYRNLPIILVTVGKWLDYSCELADVSYGHYIVNDISEVEKFLDYKLPIHIEVDCTKISEGQVKCPLLGMILEKILDVEDYLYVGQGVLFDYATKCKTVFGGMPNCYDGALANVLGASLSRRHKKYIGVVSELEMIHDINTLGNINTNDQLVFIVICNKKNGFILDYANSTGFTIFNVKEQELSQGIINRVLTNGNKSVLVVYQED